MMKFISAVGLGLSLVGCGASSSPIPNEMIQLNAFEKHPFIGCWESENGLSREGWTVDPSGWLVGYSLTRDDAGGVRFFEHMRIETRQGKPVLIVTGQNGEQTEFPEEKTENSMAYHYVNKDHDFPQRIVYLTREGRLDAYISDLSGNKRVDFPKKACAI